MAIVRAKARGLTLAHPPGHRRLAQMQLLGGAPIAHVAHHRLEDPQLSQRDVQAGDLMNCLSLRLLPTTKRLDRLMAAAATMGLSNQPLQGKMAPAAKGMSSRL